MFLFCSFFVKIPLYPKCFFFTILNSGIYTSMIIVITIININIMFMKIIMMIKMIMMMTQEMINSRRRTNDRLVSLLGLPHFSKVIIIKLVLMIIWWEWWWGGGRIRWPTLAFCGWLREGDKKTGWFGGTYAVKIEVQMGICFCY